MTGYSRVSARGGDRATAPSTRGDGTDVGRLLLVAVALALGGSALLVGLVGGAAGAHDSPGNYTVVPDDTPADRQPGIEDASYRMFISGGVAIDKVDMGYLEWEEGGFADCGQTNVQKYGIDRGDDDPGTQTEEGLLEHVKSSRNTEDRSTVWYYDEDDPIGEPPRFNADDEVIIVIEDCYTNPSKAGWYRIRGYTNGTAPDGSMVESDLQSHYFWIGDFDSEAAAREELGPPPSEDVETPTPTLEPTPTPTDDTAGDATATANEDRDDGSTATATSSPTETSTPGDATDDGGGDDTPTHTPTPTTAPDDENGGGGPATTDGDGAGFGAVVVLAVLAIAVLARGRRR